MNRAEFIEKWKHEVAGMVCDGATIRREGAELALFLRNVMVKVNGMLDKMHQDATAPKQVAGKVGDKQAG